MEYNVSVLLEDDGGQVRIQMEQKHTSTLKLWNPEDLEIPEETTTNVALLWRWRLVGGACLAMVLVVIVLLVGWQTLQIGQYQHIVQQNASWVAQQSARETTCFRQAGTAAQRTACAQAASAVTASLQRQFGTVPVPMSQNAAANAMQNAFAALDAAACYDKVAHTADDTCLSGISSRLQIAVLDAHDAAQN